MEDLLVRIRIVGTTDSQINTGLLLQLVRAVEENGSETCTVYYMCPDALPRRTRLINDRGELTYLFQGEAPVTPIELRGTVYPGDRALHAVDAVTIQLHTLDLTREKRGREIAVENVPVVAVWVPERLARGWINQNQPVQD
jgi:hypothetical protein